MAMIDNVRIGRRFLRSIRIDADLQDPRALEGFICPQTSAEVLRTMARHIAETGQGAFTWTGPYGSGKSSLVVALSTLLSGDANLRQTAAEIFGSDLVSQIGETFQPGSNGWRICPVVGSRADPVDVIGDALTGAGILTRQSGGGWTGGKLVEALAEIAQADRVRYGGVIIFIDEMGKFLEGAAQDGTDIYLFQQLAEVASRSRGRLIVVGILHQAFEEYAHRLSQDMRDEWAKIQGRFIDLAVNAAGEEQIDLISRAIESNRKSTPASNASRSVAALLHRQRPAEAERLASMLEDCWPLHPVVACLLGPISRRRFGQNQRSIFGFLNSAEPHGFQDFLRGAENNDIYTPERLWDYLRANLEPSILASPDGHRWALAAEALERCESIGGDELHIAILKTIAIIDLFKERAALVPRIELLSVCFPTISKTTLKKRLAQLNQWSFTTYRKFTEAHAIFAGSDFDIEKAVREALEDIDVLDFSALKELAGLHPILAKRHYHDTGTLRWFDVNLAPAYELPEIAAKYQPDSGTIGQFVLVVPTEGEKDDYVEQLCREAAKKSGHWDLIAGVSKRAWGIVALARELLAIETVRATRSELSGDSVARREVNARASDLQAQLEAELQRAFDGALWYRKHHKPKTYRKIDLYGLASELADRRFDKCPILHNELLNRQKPSGSAVAAQNGLLQRMVLNEGKKRLGIEGFPPEGGLFASLLEATNLYREQGGRWAFAPPDEYDNARLAPLWKAAINLIRNASGTVAVSELYALWRAQPYGVKDGLLPFLAVAFILSQRGKLAVYREGIFRAQFQDIDVDYLTKDASAIQIRWMDLSDIARNLLSGMADVVRDLDEEMALVHLEPIDVARGLVGIYEKLPHWTKRTMRLSANAIKVRELFKRARDPNQFLFDDIPAVAGLQADLSDEEGLRRVIASVREGLEELVSAYPIMMHRLRDTMLAELRVPNNSPQALAELRERAENIRELAGDFHTEAFVGRVSQFDGTDASLEGIASLAASKPPRNWVDPDFDRAVVDIAEMAQKFVRAETFARVKGRPEKRHSMAVVVGINGHPTPLLQEFDIADADRYQVDALIERITMALDEANRSERSIILAALAELSARYILHSEKLEKGRKKPVVHHG